MEKYIQNVETYTNIIRIILAMPEDRRKEFHTVLLEMAYMERN